MRVLFLDIDGVLNSVAGWRRDFPTSVYYFTEECVKEFSRVLAEIPDLKIVVSSAWRVGRPVSQLKTILKDAQIEEERILDKTANNGETRGEEINAWLSEHPQVTKFCVVDDCTFDFGESLLPHTVKTNPEKGLTKEDADAIIAKLKFPI